MRRDEDIVLGGLNDESEFHGRGGHLDGYFRALILCTVHDVGPLNQFGDGRDVEAEAGGGNVRQKAGAGGVVHIEELASAADGVLLAGQKMLLVLRSKKGREVMVKPPVNAGRGGVLEVDDGVFVAGKFVLVEQGAGPMHQAVVLVNGAGGDALAMEAREERS
jgi:hypothetical protein